MFKNLIVLAAMVLVSSEVFAQMTIRGVDLKGSGCGPTTAQAIVTPDGQTLSVLFDKYSAEIGEGSENPQLRQINKTCEILITADVPAGVQYSIERVNFRGFAALPTSAHGYHRFSVKIPGQAVPSLREAQLKGGIVDNYDIAIAGKPGRNNWSTCNSRTQQISILSDLMVRYLPTSRDTAMAQITLDSTDVATSSQFKLIWQRCK